MNVTLFQSEIEKQAGLVLGKIIGGTAEGAMSTGANIFGGLLGDRIREWRTRNLVSQLAKTAEFLQAKGISLEKARALPMGESYAMFEEASKQDDPDVSDMWSALLANAMDAQNGTRIEPAYVAALRTFSGIEARILKLLFDVAKELDALTVISEEYGQKLWSSPGEDAAALNARSKIESARAAYISNCNELFVSRVSGIAIGQMNIAIANLITANCVVVDQERMRFMSLTKTDNIEGASFEYLDKRKVAEAFNSIRRTLEYAAGAITKLPDLIYRYGDNDFYINYSLTEFGQNLVRACEKPPKTM